MKNEFVEEHCADEHSSIDDGVVRYATEVQRHLGRSARIGIIALITLFVLNGCFIAIRFADGLLPRAQVASVLRTGFEHGAMSVDPWPRNIMQGRDLYSDCTTAQIAVIGDDTLTKNALAPRLMSPEQLGHGGVEHNACDELQRYLSGTLRPMPGVTYTRFWHGAATALNLASVLIPLDGYRAFLISVTLGLIAACAVGSALVDRRVLIALAPLFAASFLVGGQLGYAQLISYGPAVIAVWAVVLVLVIRRLPLSDERLAAFAVTAGALEAFFDQMISVPLVAAIFVAVSGTLAPRQANRPFETVARMTGVVAAWCFGLAGTYAVKLGLSTLLIGTNAFHEFTQQLAYRAGTVDTNLGLGPETGASRPVVATLALMLAYNNMWRLGYADEPGLFGNLLALLGVAGWALALASWVTAFRSGRGAQYFSHGAGYIAAALVVLGWFLMFPEHALRHKFTVRVFIIWIVGGWGWLCTVMAFSYRFESDARRPELARMGHPDQPA